MSKTQRIEQAAIILGVETSLLHAVLAYDIPEEHPMKDHPS